MTTTIRHLIVIAALVAGCSKKEQAGASATRAATPAMEEAQAASGGEATKTAETKESGLATLPAQDNRKIIRTGRIELVVATYDDARGKLDALIERIGGYVDSTQVTRRQGAISDATIVVRIPSSAFGSVLPKLREIGEVVSESTDASDITAQYVDIAARLASAKTLEKRLLELATDKTGKIDQVLAVERELSRVRTEIEGYEGRMRQWNDQIAMSTLTLSLSTKRPEIVAAAPPTLGSRIGEAFHDSVDALRAFGGMAIVTLIALAPWLVLLIPMFLIGRRLARRYIKLPAAFARRQPIAPSPPAPPPPAS